MNRSSSAVPSGPPAQVQLEASNCRSRSCAPPASVPATALELALACACARASADVGTYGGRRQIRSAVPGRTAEARSILTIFGTSVHTIGNSGGAERDGAAGRTGRGPSASSSASAACIADAEMSVASTAVDGNRRRRNDAHAAAPQPTSMASAGRRARSSHRIWKTIWSIRRESGCKGYTSLYKGERASAAAQMRASNSLASSLHSSLTTSSSRPS